jgi:imidazolonepropionase
MWDRLFTGCSIATMDPAVPGPFGAIEDGAIAVQDGRIVRIGRRVEMAGMRAHARESLGGAWVTPGLVDCHTHLVFGGNRAAEFEQRLGGASYEEIARAGGGIMSTVKATRGSSSGELIASGRERLRALMKSGVTTVEIKTGYGLDTATELRLLNAIKALAASEPVRIVPTLLALHALPPEYADRRADYVQMVVDEMLPAAAGSVGAIDAFLERIAFTRGEVETLFKAANLHGLRVKLHADQLSNGGGAALAAQYGALSADHLEHVDEAGVAAMATPGTVAVLLPGAYHMLSETTAPPVDLLRRDGVPIALGTDCNPGTSPRPCPRR